MILNQQFLTSTSGEWQILEDKPANRKECYKTQSCDRELVTNLVEMSCTDGLYHGSVCDFTCPNGFDLAGVSQASCDPETGDWNNIWGTVVDQTPCCKRKCDTKGQCQVQPRRFQHFFI